MLRLDGSRGGASARKLPPPKGRTAEILTHPERVFEGVRAGTRVKVWVKAPLGGNNKAPLPPRHDLWDHSPNGYEWGYQGSGPAQLALAILANVLSDEQEAVRDHQEFKRLVVAAFPKPFWGLTMLEAVQAIAQIRGAQQ